MSLYVVFREQPLLQMQHTHGRYKHTPPHDLATFTGFTNKPSGKRRNKQKATPPGLGIARTRALGQFNQQHGYSLAQHFEIVQCLTSARNVLGAKSYSALQSVHLQNIRLLMYN